MRSVPVPRVNADFLILITVSWLCNGMSLLLGKCTVKYLYTHAHTHAQREREREREREYVEKRKRRMK
jgi:hypothetical protein